MKALNGHRLAWLVMTNAERVNVVLGIYKHYPGSISWVMFVYTQNDIYPFSMANNQFIEMCILYIQRQSTGLFILGCYWPCRNPCVFDVELATIILSLF
jgi:hypothetical protein